MTLSEEIEKAIREEIKAQEKYRQAAKDAPDPETRSMLEQLASDEEQHEKMLKEKLAALKMLGK